MLQNIRRYILKLINGDLHPTIIILAAGLYPLLYYYDKNYALINSKIQFAFFVSLYIALPIVLYYLFRLCFSGIKPLQSFRKYILPIFNCVCSLVLVVITLYGFNTVKMIIATVTGIVFGRFLAQHINKIVVIQFVLTALVIPKLLPDLYREMVYSKDWMEQTDAIESVKFKKRPNIYVIQPDGYTNFSDLSNSIYNYDNSKFESFLTDKGFKLYRDYRSNYSSTLSSNSSMFGMNHHYYGNKTFGINPSHNSRNEIVGDNPVLSILKANDYKTYLMLQVPYLLANRPQVDFDSCNILKDEISFISRGFALEKDLLLDTKEAIKNNESTSNFFFIESMLPSHIVTHFDGTTSVQKERELYLERLKLANNWLTDLVKFIIANDANSLIVIASDHGGYVGLDYMKQSQTKQTDSLLVKSMFSSALAIKWPNDSYTTYDKDLKSSVNLFRTLFSYLGEDETYLKNLQKDDSYLVVRKGAPVGVYRFIDTDGNFVFETYEE